MEEKPQLTLWERSTTRRFLRWLFSGRTLRRGLVLLVWLVSLIALFFGVTDWRGRRAWNAYRLEYEAQTAPLALPDYIPKEIPDSENFATTPFALGWIKDRSDTNALYNRDAWSEADKLINSPPKTRAGQKYGQKYLDLVARQNALAIVQSHAAKPRDGVPAGAQDMASRVKAAPGVLDGLKDDKAVLEELRAASNRRGARYPLDYNMQNPVGILLPHLAKIKQTCNRLQGRACAELALGQSDNALQDVQLILYLADSIKAEPFLISYLVRIACVHIGVDTIWEGLAEHRWTDVQLQQLQARLEPYNFLADLQQALHAERALGVLMVDLVKQKGLMMAANWGAPISSPPPHSPERFAQALVSFLIPAGWYDQEMLHYCQGLDSLFKGSMDVASKRVFPKQVADNVLPWQGSNSIWNAVYYHTMIATLMLPSVGRVPVKAATAQMSDQAVIACALERYRLASGQYPENLAALVPRFITTQPKDVIGGEAYHYRRTDDGRFLLYSVGWNETDDGGYSGKTMFDQTEGDWVWEYPASSGESHTSAAR